MIHVVTYKYVEGITEVYPSNRMVRNWLFTKDTEDEAVLANSIAIVAEKNGITINELQYIFPSILRMLKSDIDWSK